MCESAHTYNIPSWKRRLEACLEERHIQRRCCFVRGLTQRMYFVGRHIHMHFHKHDKFPVGRHLNVSSRKTCVDGTASRSLPVFTPQKSVNQSPDLPPRSRGVMTYACLLNREARYLKEFLAVYVRWYPLFIVAPFLILHLEIKLIP